MWDTVFFHKYLFFFSSPEIFAENTQEVPATPEVVPPTDVVVVPLTQEVEYEINISIDMTVTLDEPADAAIAKNFGSKERWLQIMKSKLDNQLRKWINQSLK